MPSINELMPARFFTAEHVKAGSLKRVIESVGKENTAPDDKPVENKVVMRFTDEERGCVINRERADQLTELFGEDVDQWVGKTVTIQVGKTKFAGKTVPCVAFAKA